MTTITTAPLTSRTSTREIDLRPGLAAAHIDHHLRGACQGRDFSNRILAFYFDELHESRKYRDLGYTCLAQYADQRLGLDPRRARELCRAGRALLTLTRIDAACRDGRLCWTKAELLTHGVAEHEQQEWIERALRLSCTELRRMLQRHRKGLSVEPSGDGGLPRTEVTVSGAISSERYTKLERIREELMRRWGTNIDDGEVLAELIDRYVLPERDAKAEAKRAVACEQDSTPEWLRRTVLARDGYRCRACGVAVSGLHAHHIVFRSRGGLTVADNLTTLCAGCHGLVHEGRLFASGEAGRVEFRNRFGEPLVAGGGGTRVPVPVLRLLCRVPEGGVPEGGVPEGGVPEGDVPEGDVSERGGRPPTGRRQEGRAGRSVGRRSGPRVDHAARGGGRPPRYLSETEIPDPITPEWFQVHMHLLEPGRDGVWRIKDSARR